VAFLTKATSFKKEVEGKKGGGLGVAGEQKRKSMFLVRNKVRIELRGGETFNVEKKGKRTCSEKQECRFATAPKGRANKRLE